MIIVYLPCRFFVISQPWGELQRGGEGALTILFSGLLCSCVVEIFGGSGDFFGIILRPASSSSLAFFFHQRKLRSHLKH